MAKCDKRKTDKRQHKILRELYIALRVSGLEATKAYIQAGGAPNYADRAAWRLENIPEVKAEIQRRLQLIVDKLGVTGERITAELVYIAFSDIGDVLKFDQNGVVFNDSESLSPSVRRCISEVSQVETKTGTNLKLKLHDKLKALETLARIKGMLKDNLKVESDQPLAKVDQYIIAVTQAEANKQLANLDINDAKNRIKELTKPSAG